MSKFHKETSWFHFGYMPNKHQNAKNILHSEVENVKPKDFNM